MTANEIRRSFLAYFEGQGHRVVPSAPLVPHDDPTLLFTNAGMNQFKDVLLGRETRDYTRATTVQKIMRVSGKHNDLDNVGPSYRHHTFFEMLGNFSFGDYSRKDALPFAWELLTEVWKMPKDKFVVSIFKGEKGIPRDDEAYGIWRSLGIPPDRILELGEEDNFWTMGDTGPCGRSSEIYFVRGGTGIDPEIELWNNVFMEFERQADGTLTPLPATSIDTGLGLERITAVLQGKDSNYDTDLFTPLFAALGEMAGTTHRGTMDPSDVSMRVVADHTRAMTFLIADGVVPSNEWRGYVLRKIMRRAMRHGKRLGLQEPFLHALVPTMVREFGEAYPELVAGQDAVTTVIRGEEERFDAVLTAGLPRLEEALDEAAGDGGVVSGDAAFRLYDTFGLPRDFIEDMIEERHLRLDTAAFERALEGQRTRARAGSRFKAADGGAAARPAVSGVARTAFCGYEQVRSASRAVALVRRGAGGAPETAERLAAGETGWVVLDETPFYLESGGQVSDTGMLHNAFGFAATVTDVEAVGDGVRGHLVQVDAGEVTVGAPVTAEVDAARRAATRRNHTATHLLHAALRAVLGDHVKQAGSLVAPDRLRFDFVHFAAVTRDQMAEIERLVNEQVLRNTAVVTEVKATAEAMAAGAMALFGEKYGDRVRVVAVPGYSLELCGGTHVAATGEIGLFAITGESGVAAGTRRIEATTGLASLRAYAEAREELGRLGAALNARPGELVAKVTTLQDEHKRAVRELQAAKVRAAMAGGGTGGATAAPTQVTAGGVALVAERVEGLDREALRGLVDRHRSRMGTGVVVLAAAAEGKVSIVVGVTPDLTTKAPAGKIVKELAPLVGGRGGGRPDFAEAGGKDVDRISEMLAAAPGVVEAILGTA